MHRFFADSGDISGGAVTLSGSDCAHMSRVLRLRPGDRVTVCDGAGTDYECELVSCSTQSAELRILGARACQAEPPARITLYQAIPKGDKLDGVVKRAVELGVHAVVPVITARCVALPASDRADRRRERLAAIAREAAKQSGRGLVPQVFHPIPFAQALREMATSPLRLMPYECERTRFLSDALRGLPACDTAFIIGPEGGFDETEVAQAAAAGLIPVSLGPRVLRTETASAYVLSALTYHWERG